MNQSTKRTMQLKRQTHKDEEGLALVLSLLMGLVMIGGISGLLFRQLGARKSVAGESYQQMAENAASNGFNRILSALNDDTAGEYLGYLYRVNSNNSNGSSWEAIPQLEEPCAAKNNVDRSWLLSEVSLQSENESLSTDKLGDLKSSFRLRRYIGPTPGKSSAQFEVEGFVNKEGSNNSYDARSLLIRSLYINSKVATTDDWAVLAARNYRLGDAKIDGDGKILWLMSNIGNFNDSDSCNASNLLGALDAKNGRETDLAERIWPVINVTSDQWDIPSPDRFEGDGTYDKVNNNSNQHRIWSFDDSSASSFEQDTSNYGLLCGNTFSVVCSRPSSANPSSNDFEIPINDDQIELETTLTTETIRACVTIKEFNSTVFKKIFSVGEIYPNESICNQFDVFSMQDIEVEIEKPIKRDIVIKSNDLCSTTSNKNVCHVFIEHINLSTTRVFFENSNRPIVIHLELPTNGGERRSDLQTSYKYSLAGTSKLCGANNNSFNCNQKSDAFVIASSKGNVGLTCNNQDDNSTLVFGGNNIPAAWINLPKGRVQLNSDASIRGVIWANSICTDQTGGTSHELTLVTKQINGNSVVEQAEQLWDWDDQKRYGRTVVRGVRGTGFDTFTRF
jgi:hypothetical protein